MISEGASSRVDRGEAPQPKIARTLRHFLGFDLPLRDDRLHPYAGTVVDMVAADASEVQVASYLGSLEEEHGKPRSPARQRRLEAIALWHMAKAALTRDRALRLLRGEREGANADRERLSEWLAKRIQQGSADRNGP